MNFKREIPKLLASYFFIILKLKFIYPSYLLKVKRMKFIFNIILLAYFILIFILIIKLRDNCIKMINKCTLKETYSCFVAKCFIFYQRSCLGICHCIKCAIKIAYFFSTTDTQVKLMSFIFNIENTIMFYV